MTDLPNLTSFFFFLLIREIKVTYESILVVNVKFFK